MIHPTVTISLTRLQTYYPEFTKAYRKLRNNDQDPIEMDVPITLTIGLEDDPAFTNSFALLMEKYGIEQDYWSDIAFITQYLTSELNQFETISNEIEPDTDNAIRFLIAYQELIEEEKAKVSKLKLTEEETAKRDPIAIQVKGKKTNGGYTLDYFRSGPLIMKQIFNSFKTSFANPTLNILLEPFAEIPSKEELINMIPTLKLERALKILLKESAEILTDYFKKYLPEEVYSRRKNLIIFELLYLFGTLKYGGKIAGKEMSKFPERTLKPVYSLPVPEAKCTAIIKELLKKDIS